MTDELLVKEVGLPACFEGLGEEATEVAHAAFKVGRALRGENPTPVTAEEAKEELREELADLLVYCQVLGIYPVAHTMEEKKRRWKDRVEERRKDDRARAEPGGEGLAEAVR